MNYSAYYSSIISRIYVTGDAARLSAVQQAREVAPSIPHFEVSSREEIPPSHLNQRSLFVTTRRGKAVTRCPGTHGHLCCNYLTTELYSGCTLGCSYCIMQSYLNFSPITVYADVQPVIDAVKRISAANPRKWVRFGSGETGDSLQFDPLFGLSREVIAGCADLPNVSFEMKTKSDYVDHLLSIPKKGNAVVAFSLNPPALIAREEPEAVSLDRRLEAARKAAEAGFRLAFHFDPIIAETEWERQYAAVVRRLEAFPASSVAWISLGTVRFTTALRERIAERPYLFDEFVPCRDGKYRYLQKRRTAVYREMRRMLGAVTDAPVYLCMESDEVWRRVYGQGPGATGGVADLFGRIEVPV